MKIRTHLIVLALGAVAPVLAFSAVMTTVFWNQQRSAFHERFLDRVRGMTIALDRELDGYIRALLLLRESPFLKSGDLQRFYEAAKIAQATQPTWVNITLVDIATGRQVINLPRPFGTELPEVPEKELLAEIVQRGRPAVTAISRGPVSREYATRVVVPVKHQSWRNCLSSYPGIAPDATLTLIDQNGTIIARTLNHERWIGKPPAADLLAGIRRSPEAAYRSIGLEGQHFYSAHSRSKVAGWTLATGVPAASVEAALRSSTIAMGAGAAATALLAIALAFVFGRRIAQPVTALARTASELPSGAITVEHHSGIAEVEEVSRAFHDAARQLRADEEELRYQTQLLRTITDHAPSMLLLIDAERRVTYANPATEHMTGFKPEELVGRRMHETIRYARPDGSAYPAEECTLNHMLSLRDSVRDHEETFIRKDGAFFDALCSASPILRGDQQVGTVVEVQDITRRKRYEEDLERRVAERTAELERTVEQREQLQEQLLQSQKMESLGTLAGGIAHDFNNILNIILGYASTLSRGASGDLSEGLKVIRDASERGAALVRQLLTVAHKDMIEFEPVDLHHFLQGLAGLLRETLPKTVAISVAADPSLPRIMANPNRLHQAVLNLALNARDAMPQGGALKFTTSRVAGAEVKRRFHAADADEYLAIAVSDTGEGIEPAVRDRIFDPFFTTKEQGRGTGLGLTVAYGIVSSHGGFIEMQSQPRRGATFQIYLPLRPVDGRLDALERPKSGRRAERRGRETLLFVEDEVRQARLMKTYLENHGYQVIVAHDGVEAVSLHQQRKKDIALVILDLGLPRLGGWEAYQRIKQQQPEVKTIFASGYIQSDLKSEMTRSGATVIHKPYLPEDLLAQINAVIGRVDELHAD